MSQSSAASKGQSKPLARKRKAITEQKVNIEPKPEKAQAIKKRVKKTN